VAIFAVTQPEVAPFDQLTPKSPTYPEPKVKWIWRSAKGFLLLFTT